MLRPKKHITRQKLKEDKFVTETMKVVNWLKSNQKVLTYGLIGAAVVIVILWGSLSAREAAEREASILTLQAGYALESNNLDQARILLLEAVENFGTVPSAGRATFMLGHVLFRLGQIDSARVFYDRYLNRFAKGRFFKAAATAGLAACLEQTGDWTEAAEQYTEAARLLGEHISAADYLLQAGRCWTLAGRTEQAITVYEQLTTRFPDSGQADRAAILRAEITANGP